MPEKFDAIVVGAGPSGNAATYTLAKAGLKVLQIERGEYPGSKNVQGAILYSDALEKIIPDFRDDAPLERHIIEQRMWLLDDQSFVGTHFRSEDYNKPPYNRYTIIRAQFDKWFSSKVREAGFHPEIQARNVALAVKEILFMPEEVIQARFNIGEEEGVVIEMMGSVTEGMVGTGFLYTNKATAS